MFVRSFLGPVALAATQIVIPLGHPRVIEPPKAPIESAGPLWVARCNSSDDPTKAAPPVRIHGNAYLVGTCGISSILIIGDQGDILIDGGPEAPAPLIAANIDQLGVKLQEIRYILTNPARPDHTGALAALQRLTGATVVTTGPVRTLLEAARPDQPNGQEPRPSATEGVAAATSEGRDIRLGNLMLTEMATAGHLPGFSSWRWTSCDGGMCRAIVYVAAPSPISSGGPNLPASPASVAAYRIAIAKLASSPCEILVTAQPGASKMAERLALGRPLFDPLACKRYANQLSQDLDQRLAKEPAK